MLDDQRPLLGREDCETWQLGETGRVEDSTVRRVYISRTG